MDIISYKGGRALFIDSEDIMSMDRRLGGSTQTPRELAIRMIVDNRKVFGINAIVIVTSFDFQRLPKFLREILPKQGVHAEYIVSAKEANCFRREWWDK